MEQKTNYQVPSHTITPISELSYEKCSKNAFKVSLINTLIFLFTSVIIALVAYYFINEYLILLLALSILPILSFLIIIHSWFYYKNLSYALREKDITLKSGVIFRSKTTMPYIRVQHSEVNQSLIQRYFKISDLHLYTAGGNGVDMTIKGLEEEHAERIKNFIIRNNTLMTKLNGEED